MAESGVSSGVDLVAVAVVAAAESLPDVPCWEPPDRRELVDVPNLMQKKVGIEHDIVRDPDRATERDAGDRPPAEAPATDVDEDAAAPESRRPKLWKAFEHAIRQRRAAQAVLRQTDAREKTE